MRTKLLLLIIATTVAAGAAPVISGCGATTNGLTTPAGTPCSIAITPASAVTLTGGGSITCTPNCTAATNAVFTPPASISVHTRFGCPMQPPDSIFNTRVDTLPLHPSSVAWKSGLSTGTTNVANNGLNPLPSWGMDLADSTTPTKTYVNHYTQTRNSIPFPAIPATRTFRQAGGYDFDFAQDHHSMYVRRDTCNQYELYGDGHFSLHSSATNLTTGSSNFYSGNTYDLSTDAGGTTNAAGLPINPLVVHASDVRFGLKHMSAITLCTGCISVFTHYWPARTSNGGTNPVASYPSNGAIARLRSTYDCTVMGAMAQNICNGWKQYGLVISDNGGSGDVWFDSDVFEDPATALAIVELRLTHKVLISDLEWVDQLDTTHSGAGTMVVNAATTQVNPSGIAPPTGYSIISATASATTTKMPIAVQPIAIGTKYERFFEMAGGPAYQISTWVNGASNQGVTWVHTSGPGSVTTGGMYSPPATVASRQLDILTGTAAADANAKINVIVTVDPRSFDAAFRIDVGGPGCTAGAAGCAHTWLPDYMYQASPTTSMFNRSQYIETNPSWSLTGDPEWFAWRSQMSATTYNWGPWVVPNGNYTITVGYGPAVSSSSVPGGTYNPAATPNGNADKAATVLTANDSYGGTVDMGLQTPTKEYWVHVPHSYFFPVTVTDQTLIVRSNALGISYNNGHVHTPVISVLTVAPDTTTAPHWSIDQRQTKVFTPGSTNEYNCVRDIATSTATDARIPGTFKFDLIKWFAAATPAWSVIAGPGSIDSTGCYTGPSSITSTSPVTVKATGGGYSATATIYLQGSTFPAAIR